MGFVMATLTSQLIVRLIDGVSGPARGAAAALRRLHGEARTGSSGAIVAMQERVQKATERNKKAITALQGRLIGAAAGAWGAQRAVSGVATPAIKFESAMADVAKVSDFSEEGLKKYGKQLRELAVTEIPMAVEELAALSYAASQSGVPEEDLLDFTRLTAKAAVAWDVTGASAGESLAKLREALQMTNAQTALFADAINHLSDNTASSAPDLIDYARRVASQGEFFGFAKEQTMAFGAAMIGSGAQSNVAATSFRNMGRALTKGAAATAAQRRGYKALGLDARKVAKAMQKDAVGTTITVMERLGQLPEEMQASVMSELFGDEARALAPLLNRLDILRKALGLVADEQEYADSVGKEFARRAQTTEYELQRFNSQLRDIALSLGAGLLPAIKEATRTLGPYLLQISDFVEKHAEIITKVLAVSVGLVGLSAAAIAASLGFKLLTGGFLRLASGALMLVKPLAWLSGAGVAALGGIIGYFAKLRALSSLRSGLGGRGGVFFLLGRDIAALAKRAGSLLTLRGAMSALFAMGPKGWLLAAAVAAIAAGWEGIKAFGEGFGEGFLSQFDGWDETLKPLVESFGRLGEAVGKLMGFSGSADSWREIGKAFGEIAGGGVQLLINAITKIVDALTWVVTKAGEAKSALSSFFSAGDRAGGTPANDRSRQIPHRPWEGQRSRGGRVSKGHSYLVGERRPEIFTPGQSGYVNPRVPGGSSGSTVNVTNHFTINGSGDLNALSDLVARKVEKSINSSFRGVQADTRTDFGY